MIVDKNSGTHWSKQPVDPTEEIQNENSMT